MRPGAWLPAAKGLAIGFAAALVWVAVHAPLPWMIGPLVAVAACRSAGIECAAPAGGRQTGQWIIGTALGLYFTPPVAELVTRMWWLLLFAAVFALALGYFCGYLVARLAGIDRTTAVFASVPGGAAEMSVLGERYGARVDEVAAAQSLRLMLVVVVIPWVFAALNAHGADVFQPGTTEVEGLGLTALLAATLVGGLALQRFHVANAFVLGALAVAIPLTVAEVNLSAVSRWLTNAAQLLLGCALGARFERSFLRRAPRFVAVVVVSNRCGNGALGGLRRCGGRGGGSASRDARARNGARRDCGDVDHRQGARAGGSPRHRVSRHARRPSADLYCTTIRVAAAPAAPRTLALVSFSAQWPDRF